MYVLLYLYTYKNNFVSHNWIHLIYTNICTNNTTCICNITNFNLDSTKIMNTCGSASAAHQHLYNISLLIWDILQVFIVVINVWPFDLLYMYTSYTIHINNKTDSVAHLTILYHFVWRLWKEQYKLYKYDIISTTNFIIVNLIVGGQIKDIY